MLNQVVLVGRLTDNPEVVTTDTGKKLASVSVAVQRTYKNVDGLYEADFIRCVLWNGIAANTSEYCKKGDVVGIKGRLQSRNYESNDGIKKYVTEVIAEKVTFLTNSKKDKIEELTS